MQDIEYNINIIVAMDHTYGIGKANTIPWQGLIPRDMRHFVDTTKGKTVVMGRKTWDSIPENFKPLPNRENIILTKDRDFSSPEKCHIFYDVQAVLAISKAKEVWIIGGAEIYNLFLPYANRILATYLNERFECDTFFPPISLRDWNCVVILEQEMDKKNQLPFRIFEFKRLRP